LQNIELKFLSLVNYRNYASLSLHINENLQVITGQNGAGKTTILDAIYYICNGKSYFTHLDRYITDFFRVEAKIKVGEEAVLAELSSKTGRSKSLIINEKKVSSLAEIVGKMPAFMIAPRDILIIMESSIERRKVMDRTISLSDRQYLLHLLSYNKLLKQRNAYLKEANKKGIKDPIILESLNKSMEAPSSYIVSKRQAYLLELEPLLAQFYEQLSGDAEKVNLTYKSELIHASLPELLEQNVRKDLILGKTSSGIHRDDISIFINDRPIKKYASEGQLKSAIVALKLAQLEWIKKMTGKQPILLLDDIFDKLDKYRVRRLLELADKNLAAQIYITDTDEERVVSILKELGLAYNTYNISNGKVIN